MKVLDDEGRTGVRSTDPREGRSVEHSVPGYQRLVAWQKAMDLVKAIYETTREWPREELFGLTNQVRRAAVSVPSNIAEGHGRSGPQEYAHHLSIAYGSLCELETQLLIARDLSYGPLESMTPLLDDVANLRRVLLALLKSIRSRSNEKNNRQT